MLIREIEARDLGLLKAYKLTELVFKVFAEDNYSRVLLGPLYIKALHSPDSGFRYKKLILFFALDLWKRSKLHDNRNWEVIDENGKIIGYSSWNVPEGSQPEPSVWSTAQRWLLNKIVNFGEYILSIGDGKDSLLAQREPLQAATKKMDDEIGWLKVPDSALAHYDHDMLLKTMYHRKKVWWCSKMIIDPEYQRQGYGVRLFEQCLRDIEPFQPTFRDGAVDIKGPAKYGLCSSDSGQKLYEKFGFRLYKSTTSCINGIELKRPIYMKNYSGTSLNI